jgi:ParB family chromosome partitioning protein
LTPSEAVSIGRPIEELKRKEAKGRQGTRTDLPQHSGKLPESDKGDTRDKIGPAVGMSGRTYEKAPRMPQDKPGDPMTTRGPHDPTAR